MSAAGPLSRMPRRQLAVALALAGCAAVDARPRIDPAPGPEPAVLQATFNAEFIRSAGGSVDLARFSRGNVTLPGIYQPRILINGQPTPGAYDITFREPAGGGSARPCLTRDLLLRLGLDSDRLDAHVQGERPRQALGAGALCGPLAEAIPGATVDFDEAEQLLRITIPQAYMASQARGYVAPELWDAGETAAMINYNANRFSVNARGRRSTSTYLGINAGVNVAGWRIRQNGGLSVGDAGRHWRNTAIYATHDLTDLRSQLTLGELYSSGDILDSVRLRGVGIASDPRMLPASQRGYAPVIRGVAEGNAQVTVRQNGVIIHSSTVSPGPFEIADLYPTGYGSDLELTVTEADGRTRSSLVPYTAVPQMVREGATQVALWAGQVAEDTVRETPFIAQGTVQRGVSANTTLYSGGTISNSYAAALLGGAVNLPFGALALDVTGSRAAMRGEPIRRGVSTRLRYSRTLAGSGTSFGIAAYRFSTRDYLGVSDATRLRSLRRRGIASETVGGERSRLDANLGQGVGRGRLTLQASLVDFWGQRGRSVDYTLGYANHWRALTYNVSLQRSRVGNAFLPGFARAARERTDSTLYVSFNLPLGRDPAAPGLGVSTNRANDGSGSAVATLSGRVARDENLRYSLSATRADERRGSGSQSGGANLMWRGPVGSYRASVTHGSSGSSQYALAAQGGVVAHRHGVTFSQELGETNAIVHAPGAAGSHIEGHPGIRLDRRGNAVIRGLLPYQLNPVAIDPRGASHDVRLRSTSEVVAPRAGAMVRMDYETQVERTLLVRATRAGQKPIPFGAEVLDANGRNVGVVGQGGKIFTRGAAPGARLRISWSGAACQITLPSSFDGLPTHGLHRATTSPCVEDDA